MTGLESVLLPMAMDKLKGSIPAAGGTATQSSTNWPVIMVIVLAVLGAIVLILAVAVNYSKKRRSIV